MSIELYLSIAGIVIIVVTIVTGLEIRKISKEINEIDIEKKFSRRILVTSVVS